MEGVDYEVVDEKGYNCDLEKYIAKKVYEKKGVELRGYQSNQS